jgi:hypothetical protein
MALSVQAFSDWLAATPLSLLIQNTAWIIPTVQSIHILAITVVIGAAVMTNLKMIGVIGRGQPTATYVGRFLPWVWPTLVVLLLSGSLLIVAEPGRSLQNPSFILKMGLLVLAIGATAATQIPVGKDAGYWEATGGRKVMGMALGVLALCLWTGIVFAGRWIAYTNTVGG